MVTHNPLHGSGQAGLPHPALTSGDNAHAAQGIRMTSAGGRQPTVDQAPHPVPKHAGFLAAPQERAMPEPTYLEPKRVQRRAVGRHSVITNVSTHDRPQPLAHFRDGVMHASFEFGLHLAQLRLQPFANRLSQNREPSITPLLPTDVGEAEEVEQFEGDMGSIPREDSAFYAKLSASLTSVRSSGRPYLVGLSDLTS